MPYSSRLTPPTSNYPPNPISEAVETLIELKHLICNYSMCPKTLDELTEATKAADGALYVQVVSGILVAAIGFYFSTLTRTPTGLLCKNPSGAPISETSSPTGICTASSPLYLLVDHYLLLVAVGVGLIIIGIVMRAYEPPIESY